MNMIGHAIYFQWRAIEVVNQPAKKPMEIRAQFVSN
jgi:hypothetical protein